MLETEILQMNARKKGADEHKREEAGELDERSK
jgi:hypothetical protein